VLYHADNVIQFISELSRIDGWLKYTVQFPKRGSMADANPTAGSMLSSVHAHPVHDRDHEDDHLRHFYRQVDHDLNALLSDGQTPVVVAGVEHEVATFHRMTTYPSCVEPGVHGVSASLGNEEVHRRAIQLLNSVPTGATKRALHKFDSYLTTGHASTDADAIFEAATQAESPIYFCGQPLFSGNLGGQFGRDRPPEFRRGPDPVTRWRRSTCERRSAGAAVVSSLEAGDATAEANRLISLLPFGPQGPIRPKPVPAQSPECAVTCNKARGAKDLFLPGRVGLFDGILTGSSLQNHADVQRCS
jgi:hypothetical protein